MTNEMRYCEEHGSNHRVGSKQYEQCFGEPDQVDDVEEQIEASGEAQTITDELDYNEVSSSEFVQEKEPEEESEEELSKTEPVEEEPVIIESASLYVESVAEGEVVQCRLKSEAPPMVSIQSRLYKGGRRVFRRKDAPFSVTRQEFNSILNRGTKLFELV